MELENDILVSGARIRPDVRDANVSAVNYYEGIRKRNDDIVKIVANTDFTTEQISLIKYYIFFAVHDLGNGLLEKFDPDYMMSESWRRLSSSNKGCILAHDVLMLEHELFEILLLLTNKFNQRQAHEIAQLRYDYASAAKAYYRSIYQDLRI